MKPEEKDSSLEGFGVRHGQALLLFICCVMGGGLNASMNVALLTMSDKNSTQNVTTFDWDKQIHGYIMSSMFWGDVVIQLISCTMVHKLGGKRFLLFGLLAMGTVATTMPFLARWGDWKGMFVGSIVQSMCSGLIVPSCHTLLGKWAPLYERTRIGNFVYAGLYLALIISFPIAAMIGASSLGWPWIFYIFGGQTIVCGVIWGILGASSPAEHKTITMEERRYIEESLEQTDIGKIKKTPWRKIFTSKPFLILIISQAGAQWGYNVMYIEMPSYFSLALGLDIKMSGLLTSLSYICAILFVFASGWASDKMINANYCSTTNMRKICNTLGTWGPALCLVLIPVVPNHMIFIIVFLILGAVGTDGINNCGYWVNHIDLSPNFAGVLIAIAQFISDLVSLLAPITTGYILDDPSDISQWNNVFLLSAFIYFIGNFIFILWGSGEKQPWDRISNKSKDIGYGHRHIQAFLMFLCLTIGYGMRVTMSVAIVAMTNEANVGRNVTVFDWSKQIQNVVLSSFFWGYTCMQIPGGHIAHRYGAKYLLVIGLTVNGLMGLILPISSDLAGWKAVCICRVIQGLAQGSFLPSLHTLLGKWAPLSERGRISTYVYGGSHVGTIVVMALSGFLADAYGWPSIFYFFGSLNVACAVVWGWFGAESPTVHRSMSQLEKFYIQRSLGQSDKKASLKQPWGPILRSKAVWAIACAHAGSSWLQTTLFTEVPSYLSKVMGIDLKANGLLSALPFAGMWFSSLFFSTISDYYINKKTFSLTVARKIANTVGKWGSAACFVILAFIPKENVTLAVIVLILAASLKSATTVGYHVNHIDISPNFAGTLMSITNTVSNCFSILAPLTSGFILQDPYDPVQWRIVFCVLAIVVFVANLFYLIFGSAKKAAWNEPEYVNSREMVEIRTQRPLMTKKIEPTNKEVALEN